MTVLYLVAGVLFGIAGYKQCEKKHRDPWLGAALGFFLGLIGLIIVLCLKEGRPTLSPLRPQAPYATLPHSQAYPAQPGAPVAPAAAQQYAAPQYAAQQYAAQQYAAPQYAAPPAPQQQYAAQAGQRYVAPVVPHHAAPPPPQPPAVS